MHYFKINFINNFFLIQTIFTDKKKLSKFCKNININYRVIIFIQ